MIETSNPETLFVLAESISNTYKSGYLFLASIISIFFGVLIIVAKNPVISILFLIGLFITISMYLILAGLAFIGLSYLLVYVGAVSILFIFILMLINVRISELLTEEKNSIPLAIITVFSFNLCVGPVLAYSVYMFDVLYLYLISIYKYIISIFWWGNNLNEKTIDNNYIQKDLYYLFDKIANVTSKTWDASMVESNHITSIGNIMYTNLFILLIITSLILLLAMVGTIVITVRKQNKY